LLLIYNFRGVNFAGIKQEGLTESIRNNEANTFMGSGFCLGFNHRVERKKI
jgi:hypothetical protein